MRSRYFRALLVCAASVVFAIGAYVAVNAASSLSTTAAVTQNFDGMGASATAALPTDFKVDALASVRTLGTFAGAGTATARVGGPGLSTTAANGIYNFSSGTTTTGPDRAVGFLASGTATTSGNLYAQFVNTTGADLSGLQIAYSVEKYRGGSNLAGFRIQLFYSTDGATWTNAGPDFLTAFPQDAANSGCTPAPCVTVPVSKTLTTAIPNGSNFYLAWNYSVTSGTTVTNAQALAVDDISVLGVANTATTLPSAVGVAAPPSVRQGDQSLLSVKVTPGTNPPSTGIAVSADLSSIGGSPTQPFLDDGHGTFSFLATVPSDTVPGTKTFPATLTDDQHDTASASISLTVMPLSTPPTATGHAAPAGLQAGNTTLLTVAIVSGSNPPSASFLVTGDLSGIGGSPSQSFHDDGLNGDATSGDNVFSFQAVVSAGTGAGVKSLPIAVTDDQSRTASAAIALTIQPPPPPTTVKISQVYGGGGNSGTTYGNDFIEIYNQGATPVDLAGWSVQEASATVTTTWGMTPLCPAGPCVLEPGRYFLIAEGAGAGSVAPLPTPDAQGSIAMSATNAKVALVANSTPLSGACPSDPAIVDMFGFGTATCFEGAPTAALDNTTAAVRKSNGCVDTDNNSLDFDLTYPIPRNSQVPAHLCADPSRLSALGISDPTGPEHSTATFVTVQVLPATGAPTTGFSVVADLSSVGGSTAQPLFDDGSNGDAMAGDGTFTVVTRIPATAPFGIRNIPVTITDGVGHTLLEPVTLTVAAPTCGVERWAVKTGTDGDALSVDLLNPPTSTTIANLRAFMAPLDPPGPPLNARVGPAETTVWTVNAMMTVFKQETDVDYHIVLSDPSGTIISEIPFPDCVGNSSPFKTAVTAARAAFDGRLAAAPNFQTANLPVQMTGVGFFDFIHGQTGVAPNGIELHPVLDISFQAVTTTTLTASVNPSAYQQQVDFTATVSDASQTTPTGQVTFFDGGATLGVVDLDAQGRAVLHTSTLALGGHSISAAYSGDHVSAPSRSVPFAQTVNKADQAITFGALPGKTFGDPDFTVTASSSSGLGVTLTILSGPATLAADTIHLTGTGVVVVHAVQNGDTNFNAANAVDQSFTVAPAAQAIVFPPVTPPTYGAQPFTITATGGDSGNPVTFVAHGACTVAQQPGIATVTIVSAGSCDVTASQAGSANYRAADPVTRTIVINQAQADLHVHGATVPYDGQPHGATGTADGVLGENLSSLLNFGATFTNVPGGTANWTFAGNTNYGVASGTADIEITRVTPAFANLSAFAIEAGTASTTVGGTVGFGGLAPTGTVSITLAGTTQAAAIGPDGQFTAVFSTASLAASGTPYVVGYTYGGDGNFNGISGTGSVRVIDTTAPSITAVTANPERIDPPNHKMADVTIGYQATDVSGAPVCSLVVASNEAVNGNGDGNTSTDWLVVDAHHVQLRAERAGGGSGRIYTITIGCADASGNRSSAAATVRVPH